MSQSEESTPLYFTLNGDLDNLFSRTPPVTHSNTTSDVASVTSNSSISQSVSDDRNARPKVPGGWDHYFEPRRVFEDGKGVYKFFCLQPGCDKKYPKSSGSSTLAYHFRVKHRPAFMEHRSAKRSGTADSRPLVQTSLTMASSPIPKRDRIYTATLEWLIGDLLPFSTLDSDFFRSMVKAYISDIDPPCSATLRALLVDHRIRLKGQLRDLLDQTLTYGAITVNRWTSRSNKSYLGITLHWLDENFVPYECALDMVPLPDRHTAANTARLIRAVLGPGDWNILPLVVSVTSESAGVMVKAAELAGIDRVACITQCIQNAVNSSLEKAQHLNTLIDKCHNLAKFFHCNPKMASALEEQQRQVDSAVPSGVVVMSVTTRWNSTLLVVQKLLRLRIAIKMVFEDPLQSEKQAWKKLQPLMLLEAEWDIVEEAVQVLSHMESMALVFSSASKGLAASLYPWVSSIQDEMVRLNVRSNIVVKFRQDLRYELKEQFCLTNLIQTASVFHPTFNTLLSAYEMDRFLSTKQLLQNELKNIYSSRNSVIQHLQQDQIPNNSGQDEDSAIHRFLKRQRTVLGEAAMEDTQQIDELRRYFSRPMAASVVEPLDWWRLNKTKYPIMAKLARKYLAIPASSVASERMFSFAGEVCTDKRDRLSEDTVSDIVFCNYASKCLAEAKSKMAV